LNDGLSSRQKKPPFGGQWPVSGVLFHLPEAVASIIYLGPASLQASIGLPPGYRAGHPTPSIDGGPVYLTFQPIRFTHPDCHQSGAWALTSRFHPYPVTSDGTVYFLWHCLSSRCSAATPSR